MIRHIVLLTFKDSISPKESLNLIKELGKLQEIIPEIASFSCGVNNSLEGLSRGYQYGFVMEFKNEEDRLVYLNDPKHIKIAKEKILPALQDSFNSVMVFDYKI
jgi:hypothetical protein